jgi:hypothetical protein
MKTFSDPQVRIHHYHRVRISWALKAARSTDDTAARAPVPGLRRPLDFIARRRGSDELTEAHADDVFI